MADSIMWPGASGKDYKYRIYQIGIPFKSIPGNYIFAKETSPNQWTPIYIGETDNMEERHANHEKMPCVRRNGGTHIHTHANSSGERDRRAEEADLLAKWDPPCNME